MPSLSEKLTAFNEKIREIQALFQNGHADAFEAVAVEAFAGSPEAINVTAYDPILGEDRDYSVCRQLMQAIFSMSHIDGMKETLQNDGSYNYAGAHSHFSDDELARLTTAAKQLHSTLRDNHARIGAVLQNRSSSAAQLTSAHHALKQLLARPSASVDLSGGTYAAASAAAAREGDITSPRGGNGAPEPSRPSPLLSWVSQIPHHEECVSIPCNRSSQAIIQDEFEHFVQQHTDGKLPTSLKHGINTAKHTTAYSINTCRTDVTRISLPTQKDAVDFLYRLHRNSALDIDHTAMEKSAAVSSALQTKIELNTCMLGRRF